MWLVPKMLRTREDGRMRFVSELSSQVKHSNQGSFTHREYIQQGLSQALGRVFRFHGGVRSTGAGEVRVPSESALVPKERIVPSRLVLVAKCDDDGKRFVKARLSARGDQDPELFSFVRNQQTSAPTVSTNGKGGNVSGHSLLGG